MYQVRKWERFQFMIDYEHEQQKKVLQKVLPDILKVSIAKNIENNLFSKVGFLEGLQEIGEIRTLFSAELILRSESRYFCKGSIIGDSREEATGLMVITSGQVGVELPIDSDDADEENRTENGRTLLNIMHRGDSIGDNVVAEDLRWGGTFGVNVDFVARTHTSVAFIKLESIQVPVLR